MAKELAHEFNNLVLDMLIAPVCEYINLWDGNILMSTIILPGNMLMRVNFPKITTGPTVRS